MRRLSLGFTGFVLCLAVSLGDAARVTPPVEQLVARFFGSTPALADLRELTDQIGGRPTGGPALDRATAWAADKLRAAGLDQVRVETYSPPRNWVPRSEAIEIAIPATGGAPATRETLRVAAMPFSPATPAAGLEAGVYAPLAADPAAIATAAQLRGKWLLVPTEPMRSIVDLFAEYLATPPLFAAARKAGAVGVLWISNRPSKLLYRHNIALDGSMGVLPGALVEREGGERLARLARAGVAVTARVTLAVDVQEHPTDRNVVAEITGGEKPDEVVILGAHLDSWDLGRGALDNGCNVALVIDVARQMAALAHDGLRPRRTVRFVLYSGEELGLYGSWFDVRAHRADLDKLDAVVIYDEGTGRTSGFSLGGRAELGAGVERALAPVASLGPFVHTADTMVGTDNYDYMLEGVPNLVANQDGAPYLADYHAESDTFDKVDTRELAANSAIAAALVWGLADDPQRLGKRQTRAEVTRVLDSTGLTPQMKTFAMWDDYAAGRRGRAK